MLQVKMGYEELKGAEKDSKYAFNLTLGNTNEPFTNMEPLLYMLFNLM